MASSQQFPPFNPSTETWDAYVARFDCFLIANDYMNLTPERKRAYFLSFCGPEMFDTAMTLMAPQSIHSGSWEEFLNKLKRHYAPAPSRFARRQHFYHRDQAPGESITQYVAALRRAARHCEFVNLDDYLLDRLVGGVRDQSLKRRLIVNHDLTFQTALDEACAAELAKLSLAELPQGQGVSSAGGGASVVNETSEWNLSDSDDDAGVCRIQDTRKRATVPAATRGAAPRPECFSCGGAHQRSSCRFKDFTCRRCGRQGHLARVCRAAQPQPRSSSPRDMPSHHFRSSNERTRNRRGSSAVNMVVPPNNLSQKKIHLTVLIEGKPCLMEVDTGSATSIVSWSTIKRLVPKLAKRQLDPCALLLKDYQGSQIPVLGCKTFRVSFKKFSGHLSLIIVDGPLPSLLGLNWFDALGLTIQGVHAVGSSELDTLCQEFPAVFDDKLGLYTGTPVSFSLDPLVQPRRLKPRRVPLALLAKVDAELDKLIAQGILEPVDHAKWETPTVIALKADGSVRICADYRATINRALTSHAYPVPVVQHLLHSLGDGSVFAKLDLAQAYQQLPVDDVSADAQTIVTHRGAFRCRRLQFGVSIAPGIFQSLMERLLHGIPGVIPYFDDVLVSATSTSALMDRLRLVLSTFQRAGLKVKKSKCLVAVPQVEFLGFLLDKTGIHPTPDKTKAILDAPPPKGKAELQAFLGLLNFYAMFLPHKASVAEPLHRLLDRGARWNWDSKAASAFQAVKDLLVSNSVLTQYCETLPLVLACDASPYGVGAVLSHRFPNGREAPVAFFSRTLAPAERNYAQIDKEALALVAGVKRFHTFLYGRPFSLITDHKPLLGLLAGDRQSPQILSPRFSRWLVFLSAYDYTLSYVPGKNLAHADALSRCPVPALLCDPAPASSVLLIDSAPLALTAADVARASARDPELSKVMDWVLRGWPTGILGTVWKPFSVRKSELSTQGGCLLWGHRVVIPQSLRRSILTSLHAGHPGVVRMKALGRAYLWWPGLDQSITEWVASCRPCQESRPMPPKCLAGRWEDPSGPWSRVHIDFAGPVHGQMFLVLVDAFSKWVEIRLMHSTSADAVIKVLRSIFCTHGLPDLLVSDNGPQLTASSFEMFLAELGIRHCLISPYHPAGNGLAERAVRSAKEALGRMGTGGWHERVAEYLLIQHSTPCQVTNQSPAELLMGRKLRTIFDRLHPRYAPSRPLDSVSTTKGFSLGDSVYARNYGGQPLWVPGRIVVVTGPCSYKVEVGHGKVWRRHQDQLRARRDGANWQSGADNAVRDAGMSDQGASPVTPQRIAPRPKPMSTSQGGVVATPDRDTVDLPGDEEGYQGQDEELATTGESGGSPSGISIHPQGEGVVTAQPRRSGRTRRRPVHLHDYVCAVQVGRGVMY